MPTGKTGPQRGQSNTASHPTSTEGAGWSIWGDNTLKRPLMAPAVPSSLAKLFDVVECGSVSLSHCHLKLIVGGFTEVFLASGKGV